jgi:hypothetical protein
MAKRDELLALYDLADRKGLRRDAIVHAWICPAERRDLVKNKGRPASWHVGESFATLR